MNKIVNINDNWNFVKEGVESIVNLPHTWNNLDGQNGENGYYQGKCLYSKSLPKADTKCYIEFNGANSVCEVFINDKPVGVHKGGYSMFRYRIDEFLDKEQNKLDVYVDNTIVSDVFPTSADFTFYGGLYRDVNLIYTDDAHFSLVDDTRKGIIAIPQKQKDGDNSWNVNITANVCDATTSHLCIFNLLDDNNSLVATAKTGCENIATTLNIKNPTLWNGIKNPYLYTLECIILNGDKIADKQHILIGFREISFDSEKGCFLNGEHIKLKGVCRHQDRENMGNAITIKEHQEDIDIILDMGANALRLAHYQQAEEFYTLCDKKGILVWAEVPVITIYNKARQQNAESQLTSLIKQNINHPSIFCWGIQNEITISGENNKKLFSGLVKLNTLAHNLDDSRPTTCAQVSMTTPTSNTNAITDLLGYNHYFGWYMQTYYGLDKWLDNFHELQPDKKLCLSEYGAEAVLRYYSENPVQGDYSEAYQAMYHEHYIDAINARDWLWGSFLWNTFDFGSAARNEGGVRGRNNKGLVTFDRKTKKDAFYIYKATWSDDKFVHINNKKYPCRQIGTTTIKVYSNLNEVTLTAGDYSLTLKSDRVFVFENVPIIAGKNTIIATSGEYSDIVVLDGVEALPKEYALPEGTPSFIRNWFGTDGTFDPKNLSINDKVSTLLNNKDARSMLNLFAGKHLDKWYINLIKPFKVKTLLKLARIDKQTADLVNGFLQTIKK